MQRHTDKTFRSRAATDDSAENAGKRALQLEDNRPRSIIQKKQIEAMAGGSPIRRKRNNDDKGLEKEADVIGTVMLNSPISERNTDLSPFQGSISGSDLSSRLAPESLVTPIQLYKGKIFQQHRGNYIIRYYEDGHAINVPLSDAARGGFRRDDKVNFDIHGGAAVNLRPIQREYVFPGKQGAGTTELLLGIKHRRYGGDGGDIFAGGMPSALGGDTNDHETPTDTVEREMAEEIGLAARPVLTQVFQHNTKTNAGGVATEQSTFHTAPDVVDPEFISTPSAEMSRAFFLALDNITAPLDDRARLAVQIAGQAGIEVNPELFTEQQGQFRDSATLSALIRILTSHRTTRYNEGFARAQICPIQAPANHSISYMSGYNQYLAGLTRAKQDNDNDHPEQIAYTAAYTQYRAGAVPAAIGEAGVHPNQRAYMAGYNECIDGVLDRHQNNLPAPALNTWAYMHGFNS
jgi:8-oxo-dGTP pyrophosphatase MutT (NUDIX family)